jgi:DnaJ-class molecular chaperone
MTKRDKPMTKAVKKVSKCLKSKQQKNFMFYIDLFLNIYSGGGQMRKGPSFRVEMDIHLEDMYHGRDRSITITRNIYCDKCSGTGAKDGKLKTCPHCKGQGVVMQNVQMGFGM